MSMTMRVSLPGIDALTNGTIDQYSLYADQDNVLIKEDARGTFFLADVTSGTFTHSLGYIPLYFVYAQVGAGRYRIASAYDPVGSGWRSSVGTADLVVRNSFGTAGSV